MNMPRERYKLVIGLTGPIASGKGLAVKTIRDYFAGRNIDAVMLSDYIREVVRAQNLPLTRETLRAAGNARRAAEGAGAWAQEMVSRLPAQGGDILLVDSIRNPGEIRVLKKAFGNHVFILATDAPMEERIQQTLRRAREEDATDPEEVRRDMLIEMEENPRVGFSLSQCREMADAVSLGKESKEERIKEIQDWVGLFELRLEAREARREFLPQENLAVPRHL